MLESHETKRRRTLTVGALIPAYNEAPVLKDTLAGIPGHLLDAVLVVDNGSDDGTAGTASSAGVTVISEPRRGYGRACLAGMKWYREHQVDIILFFDADGADDLSSARRLLEPIINDEADFVLGSRLRGEREPGSMAPHAVWGNMLAVRMIRAFFGFHYSDLGPFRAIRRSSLEALGMADKDYGWTVEMQVRAVKKGMRIKEIPVRYRRRKRGKSKVSGTVRGTVMAGWKIITTILKLRFVD